MACDKMIHSLVFKRGFIPVEACASTDYPFCLIVYPHKSQNHCYLSIQGCTGGTAPCPIWCSTSCSCVFLPILWRQDFDVE